MAPNLQTKIKGFWVSYELFRKERNLIRKQFTTLDFPFRQKRINIMTTTTTSSSTTATL